MYRHYEYQVVTTYSVKAPNVVAADELFFDAKGVPNFTDDVNITKSFMSRVEHLEDGKQKEYVWNNETNTWSLSRYVLD